MTKCYYILSKVSRKFIDKVPEVEVTPMTVEESRSARMQICMDEQKGTLEAFEDSLMGFINKLNGMIK